MGRSLGKSRSGKAKKSEAKSQAHRVTLERQPFNSKFLKKEKKQEKRFQKIDEKINLTTHSRKICL